MLELGNVQTKGENPRGYSPQKTSTLLRKDRRKGKPHWAGRAGASAGPVHPAAVPMTLTVFVRQQGRREDLWWVGRWFNRQEADPAIPDALPGFVYLALWYFSLAVNFLYQGRGGEKRLLFFNKPWERNTRKTPRPQHFGFTSSQLSATQQLRILTTTCWRDSDGKSQSVSRGESAARYSGR